MVDRKHSLSARGNFAAPQNREPDDVAHERQSVEDQKPIDSVDAILRGMMGMGT